jgi:hypothetical protein
MTSKRFARLCRFLSEKDLSDLPSSVIDHARQVLLDTLAVIIAGSGVPEAQVASRLIKVGQEPGEVINIEIGFLTPPFGVNLFVSSGVTGKDVLEVALGGSLPGDHAEHAVLDHLCAMDLFGADTFRRVEGSGKN